MPNSRALRPFSLNPTGTLSRRHVAHFSAAVDSALFVGIDAYEAAGGCVLRDLFQSDDGGWLQDPALLDRLTAEKLKTKADEIAGEGWRWIEVAVSLPYDVALGLREISRTPLDVKQHRKGTPDLH